MASFMPIGFVEPLRCQITSLVVFTLFLRATGDSGWTQDTEASAQNHEDSQQNGSEAHGIPPDATIPQNRSCVRADGAEL